MPYTTDELIHILDQELRAHWKGERVLLSSEDRLENSVIAKALGSEKLSKVFAYQDFRDQIHQYQLDHQVSGLIWKVRRFQTHSVRSPELHNQLIPIPSDKEVLVQAREDVLVFWRQATQGMTFWLAGYDPQHITVAYVEELVRQTEWAEVDAAQTEIYLSLCWGDPKTCHYQWAQPDSGCIRIIAAMSQPGSIKV
ncbi:MAG: hypothetical protein IGR76_10195 [Synechococcales cyanobacterium T60_A2020_003]|nr:hypothetical protein [Synechococcales cyanobacterium T60_A2020_003]